MGKCFLIDVGNKNYGRGYFGIPAAKISEYPANPLQPIREVWRECSKVIEQIANDPVKNSVVYEMAKGIYETMKILEEGK